MSQDEVEINTEAETDNKAEKKTGGIRDNLYSRIKIPVKTMDVIIGVLIALLVFFLAAGIVFA